MKEMDVLNEQEKRKPNTTAVIKGNSMSGYGCNKTAQFMKT
jgi:hypothetical protein